MSSDAVPAGATLVTGAASGIGRATALRLAAEGHRVAAVDIDAAGLEATVAAVRDADGDAAAFQTDLLADGAITGLVAATLERFGAIRALINVAGIGVRAPLVDTTDDQWEAVMGVNVTAPFRTMRAVLPHLLDHGGTVVNVASVAAVVGVRDRAAYCASKAALLGLTRSAAVDYAAHGIRVNAICPGTVETEWIDKITADTPDPQAARAAMHARQLDGRMGSPEEVAAGIAFLVSDDGRFVNGSAFVMDGGMTAI